VIGLVLERRNVFISRMSLMTKLQIAVRRVVVRFTEEIKISFSSVNLPENVCAPPSSYSVGTGGSFTWDNLTGQ
jgi:hypothetical protein